MANRKTNDIADSLRGVRTVWRWIYRLRSVVLAIPVLLASAFLAIYNMANLPEVIALNISFDGEVTQVITRGVAVMGPLALTAVCLLMMFCSKRVLYPWLISLFSLALPLAFLFMGFFS